MTHEQDILTIEALEPRLLFSGNVMGWVIPAQPAIAGGEFNSPPAAVQAEARAEAPLTAPADADTAPFHADGLTVALEGVERYMLRDHWGGEVVDAEKSPDNAEDDYLMCWAAAASNVLDWTGWGHVAGMADTDQMFDYYKDHWANGGLIMEYGWDWWFDGTDDSPWLGLLQSRVDTPGGGFYPGLDFYDYYHGQDDPAQAMDAIDEFLHRGYGTTLGVSPPTGGGHAVTCWGFSYDADDPANYLGVWVTDSDDDMDDPTPRDRMQYYQVRRSGDRWQLVDFYGYDDWYISSVQALERTPPVCAAQLSIRLRYRWPEPGDPGRKLFPQVAPRAEKNSDPIQHYTTPLQVDSLAKPAVYAGARMYKGAATPKPKARFTFAMATPTTNDQPAGLAGLNTELRDNDPASHLLWSHRMKRPVRPLRRRG